MEPGIIWLGWVLVCFFIFGIPEKEKKDIKQEDSGIYVTHDDGTTIKYKADSIIIPVEKDVTIIDETFDESYIVHEAE